MHLFSIQILTDDFAPSCTVTIQSYEESIATM